MMVALHVKMAATMAWVGLAMMAPGFLRFGSQAWIDLQPVSDRRIAMEIGLNSFSQAA